MQNVKLYEMNNVAGLLKIYMGMKLSENKKIKRGGFRKPVDANDTIRNVPNFTEIISVVAEKSKLH